MGNNIPSDEYQRQSALDISKSFIVQAPAGSGKTELLTQRYLALLTRCNNPEHVLVITFTNKAVDEIKKRIIDTLEMQQPNAAHKQRSFQLAQQVLQRSNTLGWDILNNYQRLNILTIDGLNAKIALNYPHSSDFSKKNTLDDITAKQLYQESATLTLLDINTQPSVQTLFTHLESNSNTFITIIAKMLQIRDKWIHLLFDTKRSNLDVIHRCITRIHADYVNQLQSLASKNVGVNFWTLCQTNPRFSHITTMPATISQWQELSELLLTKKGTLRKTIAGFNTKNDADNKAEFMAIMQQFSPEFITLLSAVHNVPDTSINQELLTAISQVLYIAHTHLQHQFEISGSVDFSQIALDAHTTLAGATQEVVSDIALLLDYQIEHILIDEFQDTSWLQLNLLQNITQYWETSSGRTLFIVGDPMQAIYQFRGGEVGVFLQVWKQGIAGVHLENLTLTHNFRATLGVVEANNALFQTIFPSHHDIDNGDISWSKSYSHNTDTTNALHIHPFVGDSNYLQAQEVVNIITQYTRNHPDYEIAILCSSTKHLQHITHYLNSNNIVFEAVQNVSLQHNIWTLELLAIIKILLNPEDRLAWFSVLRSPKIGLTLDEILELSQGDIWQNLQQNQQQRQRIIFQVFDNAFANLGSFSIVHILVEISQNFNFMRSMNTIEHTIFDKFCEIISQCEVNNTLTISTIWQKLQHLYEPSTPSNIKLMTIHQAKGLEFDVVIIPHLEKRTRYKDKDLLYITPFQYNTVLLATPADTQNYNYLHNLEKTKLHNERKRLLYVANTRAKHHIHLLGEAKYNTKANSLEKYKTPDKNSLLYLLWEQIQHHWEALDNTLDKQTHTEHMPQTIWGRYPLHMQPLTPVARYEQHIALIDTELDNAIIGTIVHKLLQLELFTPTSLQIKHQLLSAGVSFSNLEEHIQTVQNMLKTTKNSADFEFVFKHRESTKTEVETLHKGKSFIIDRLFIEDKILWIIDFKTSHNPSKQEMLKFQKQLDNYKMSLQSHHSGEIYTAIFWTASGVLQPLS
jgi:ATP-dependent exoDNAse (exonuclease V) beta subunit